ncbi:MAG: pyridine nucleotide-disulfide oxidoreductase, partial [Desulfuromonadales bacterium]
MTSRYAKIFLILTIIVLVVAFFAFDLHRFLTLESLKERQQAFSDYYSANRVLTVAIYFILYVVVTALSLPGAAVMTLAGGALLGFWVALVTVSFASTI